MNGFRPGQRRGRPRWYGRRYARCICPPQPGENLHGSAAPRRPLPQRHATLHRGMGGLCVTYGVGGSRWSIPSPAHGRPGLGDRGDRPSSTTASANGRRSTRCSKRCAPPAPRSARPTPPSARSTGSATFASGRSGNAVSLGKAGGRVKLRREMQRNFGRSHRVARPRGGPRGRYGSSGGRSSGCIGPSTGGSWQGSAEPGP